MITMDDKIHLKPETETLFQAVQNQVRKKLYIEKNKNTTHQKGTSAECVEN